jgi:hypothetical protein
VLHDAERQAREMWLHDATECSSSAQMQTMAAELRLLTSADDELEATEAVLLREEAEARERGGPFDGAKDLEETQRARAKLTAVRTRLSQQQTQRQVLADSLVPASPRSREASVHGDRAPGCREGDANLTESELRMQQRLRLSVEVWAQLIDDCAEMQRALDHVVNEGKGHAEAAERAAKEVEEAAAATKARQDEEAVATTTPPKGGRQQSEEERPVGPVGAALVAPGERSKNRKKLAKMLRQIEELRAKQKEGGALAKGQLDKLAREDEVRAELAALAEADAEVHSPSAQPGAAAKPPKSVHKVGTGWPEGVARSLQTEQPSFNLDDLCVAPAVSRLLTDAQQCAPPCLDSLPAARATSPRVARRYVETRGLQRIGRRARTAQREHERALAARADERAKRAARAQAAAAEAAVAESRFMEEAASRLARQREDVVKRELAERILSGRFHAGFTARAPAAAPARMLGPEDSAFPEMSLSMLPGEIRSDALRRAQALRV